MTELLWQLLGLIIALAVLWLPPLLAWLAKRRTIRPVHYHCPNGCEKPQPCNVVGVGMCCGRCWYEGRGMVKCLNCTPEICDD